MNEKVPSKEYVSVYTAFGQLAGEMIRLQLLAVDIPAILSQESAGLAMGLTIGRLGEVLVMVPSDRAEEAAGIIQAIKEGKFENTILAGKTLPDTAYKMNKQSPGEKF